MTVPYYSTLRFFQDKAFLPKGWDELIQTGYLQKYPIDPYCDKPLRCHTENDSFKIYSIGTNMIDDEGKGGFYPISGPIHYIPLDIVFWPVNISRPVHN